MLGAFEGDRADLRTIYIRSIEPIVQRCCNMTPPCRQSVDTHTPGSHHSNNRRGFLVSLSEFATITPIATALLHNYCCWIPVSTSLSPIAPRHISENEVWILTFSARRSLMCFRLDLPRQHTYIAFSQRLWRLRSDLWCSA